MPERVQYNYKIAVLTYKVLHDSAPRYLGPLVAVADLPGRCAYTIVYPAKGRPGSGTTKLDSGAQKHLRRSPIKFEGYGPRPSARARLARATVVPPPSTQASLQTRTAAIAHTSVRRLWGLSQSRQFCTNYLNFYTLKVEIFRMFFIRSHLPMTPVNDEKFQGNWSVRFSEIRKTHARRERQMRQLYIYRRQHVPLLN